ncbi:hypothetical protein BZA70DRAFT_272614 [Myxozyma melibiosi]|uniref:Large ribosomal subunit protein mL50 n=1 Tax=Myxozyma melibiosi TaxID=54550 RepID=A0ABR1FDN9_9ASCO
MASCVSSRTCASRALTRCLQQQRTQQPSRAIARRSLHSTRPASLDLLRHIPFLRPAKPKETQKIALDEAEKEEMEAVGEATGTAVAKSTETDGEEAEEVSEYEPLHLSEFVHRVSKIKPVPVKGVQNIPDNAYRGVKLLEIGLPAKSTNWKSKLNGFKATIWKNGSPIYDKETVYRIAQIAVGVQLGLVDIKWPENDGVIDPKQKKKVVRRENKFADIAMSASVPSINAKDFPLENINTRFEVAKKLGQLTGRPIPDIVLTHAKKVNDFLKYYDQDSKTQEKYGLFQLDPYNPKTTRLYVNPAEFVGTNVKITS